MGKHIVLLIGTVVLLLWSTKPVLCEEIYVSTVVFEVKIGTASDEFGISVYDEGKTTVSVSALFVSNNDKIYILDGVNLRVQQYNLKGQLESTLILQTDKDKKNDRMDYELENDVQMLVDKAGCVYVSSWGKERDIVKFNYDGRMVKRWEKQKFEKLFGTKSFGGIGLVNDDELYFLVYQQGFIRRYVWQEYDTFKALGKGMKGVSEDINYSFLENPGRADTPYETWVNVLDNRGKIIRELLVQVPNDARDDMVKHGVSTKFLAMDNKNMIYLLVEVALEQKRWGNEIYRYVYRYGLMGGLYMRIKLTNVAAWSSGEWAQQMVHVTSEGKVYELCCSPSKGVQVIKWDKPVKENKKYDATKSVDYDPFEQ